MENINYRFTCIMPQLELASINYFKYVHTLRQRCGPFLLHVKKQILHVFSLSVSSNKIELKAIYHILICVSITHYFRIILLLVSLVIVTKQLFAEVRPKNDMWNYLSKTVLLITWLHLSLFCAIVFKHNLNKIHYLSDLQMEPPKLCTVYSNGDRLIKSTNRSIQTKDCDKSTLKCLSISRPKVKKFNSIKDKESKRQSSIKESQRHLRNLQLMSMEMSTALNRAYSNPREMRKHIEERLRFAIYVRVKDGMTMCYRINIRDYIDLFSRVEGDERETIIVNLIIRTAESFDNVEYHYEFKHSSFRKAQLTQNTVLPIGYHLPDRTLKLS